MLMSMDKPPYKLDYASGANRQRFRLVEFLEQLPLPAQFACGILAALIVIGMIYGVFFGCIWLVYVFYNR